MPGLSIGALSAAAGVKVPTIRYYEEIGLLGRVGRTGSNRRTYDGAALRRLRFIRHARELGFEVAAIRELLALADQPDRPCADADAIARAHLADIDSRLARLGALRGAVAAMLEDCAHGAIGECRVIEVLADHAHCSGARH